MFFVFLGYLLLLYYHNVYDVTVCDVCLSHHNKDYGWMDGLYLTAFVSMSLSRFWFQRQIVQLYDSY